MLGFVMAVFLIFAYLLTQFLGLFIGGIIVLITFYWLFTRFYLSVPILIFEDSKPVDSINKSIYMTKGRVISLIAVTFIPLILYFIPSILTNVIVILTGITALGFINTVLESSYMIFNQVLLVMVYKNISENIPPHHRHPKKE
ncbi:MAG: glycerophosphoryl diester phosphodiesterase membrane domain-containing protein [Candidatus Altiarchaeota archaeon]